MRGCDLHSNSFLRAFRSSVSSKAKSDAIFPSHRTPCQNPLPSRHMILNFATEPWCQYSIFCKTASISSTTERWPKPVSVMVRKSTPDKVLEELEGTGGRVLKTSLSNKDEAKLQAALSAATSS